VDLTVEGVSTLAPDASSAAAGKKLGRSGAWTGLGRSAEALWGECQGSALYQVRVDRSTLTVACNCPSRKQPCKHGLGLLYLAADAPDALPQGEQPAWVSAWLARRAAGEKRAASVAPGKSAGGTGAAREADPPARAKRADRRRADVAAGLDALDLWLDDLVRTGLAAVETQPYGFWERQAARMVDARASGVAARLRRLAGIPNASPDWPERLLAGLGRLALLTDAYRRIETLPPLLQEDVRGAIGWTLKEDEVLTRGEAVADDWIALGQYALGEERMRVQRTWLLGARTGRTALLLQFAVGNARFAETLLPGTRQEAELVYWPSAYPQRALMRTRRGAPAPIVGPLPGVASIDLFLDEAARATARHPWLELFACALSGGVPLPDAEGRWVARDAAGRALPLARGDYWDLLALSGGHPVDLAAEWDGTTLRPLGAVADGAYHCIEGGPSWTR